MSLFFIPNQSPALSSQAFFPTTDIGHNCECKKHPPRWIGKIGLVENKSAPKSEAKAKPNLKPQLPQRHRPHQRRRLLELRRQERRIHRHHRLLQSARHRAGL